MIGLNEIRAIAMALPQVEEGAPVRAAGRIASFKVAGKSFVGVEVGGGYMTVTVDRVRDLIERSWRHSAPVRSIR